jgi:hypothetical protein
MLPYTASQQTAAGGGHELHELNLNSSLAENGLQDEADAAEAAGLPRDHATPVILLYWNDDLTVA